jgi:hypothetical protein
MATQPPVCDEQTGGLLLSVSFAPATARWRSRLAASDDGVLEKYMQT